MPDWSDADRVRIRSDVALEPLINNYYAWLHLVSPGTAAMNFTKFVGPLLGSFLKDPELHRISAADPRLRGGMFVNLGDEHATAVGALRQRLTEPTGVLARLSDAFDTLSTALRDRADGFDLTPTYQDVPDLLRGHVELVYDLEDNARLRLDERMLYRSYFDESQQCVDLSVCADDDRPFAGTTPRFGGRGHVQLRIPLRDRRLDGLFAARPTMRRFGDLGALFDIAAHDRRAFAALFTAEPDRPGQDRDCLPDETRVRYFGHACIVAQHGEMSIMTDPFVADRSAEGRYSYADLPERLDWVVITHGHHDHLELGTLLKLRSRIGTIVVPRTDSGSLQDPSLRLCLEALGFENVIEAEAGEVLTAGEARIVVCPFVGEHCDLDIGAKVTYVLDLPGARVYIGADSRGLDERVYELIRDLAGPVDVAFLGMECDGAPLQWLYGPLFSRRLDHKKSRSRKLNGSNAVEAARVVRGLGAREAYVYAMGREPWLGFIMATSYTEDAYQLQQARIFLEECTTRGVKADELLGQAEFRFPTVRGDAA